MGTIVRLLAYRNTARMGIYRDALAIAAANGTVPDIVADDREGRHKTGFGINIEQPLADDGATGAFARLGWNDGRTESFAFTEVDRLVSVGGLLSGRHWRRADDRLGAAVAVEGLSGSASGLSGGRRLGLSVGRWRVEIRPRADLRGFLHAPNSPAST